MARTRRGAEANGFLRGQLLLVDLGLTVGVSGPESFFRNPGEAAPVEAPRRSIEGMRMWRWLNALPLGMKLYFWFWTVLVPAGVALLLAGVVMPGLVLLLCFVFDQAVFTPLIVARAQRQKRVTPPSP